MNVKEMFDISGKVALVTGGGRGIGQAIAEAFLEAGAKVAFSGRREEWLNPTMEAFTKKGYDSFAIKSDVSRQADVEKTLQATLDKYGRIDILVNNAGITWGQPTKDLPMEKWKQIIDVNLNGLFALSQLVGRNMIERGEGGAIINIASVAGLREGDPHGTKTIAYNTSKAAVISLTRGLASEWGPNKIRVNAIAPGWFPTRMASGLINANLPGIEAATPLGRVGDLNELKGVALFLASPASSYMTGQTLVVDGGMSL